MNTALTLPPLVEDLSLPYRLRPAQGQAQGLLLLLHGVGGNEASLAGLAALVPAAISVALVRSPLPMGASGFAAFAVNFTADGPVIDAAAAEASRLKLVRFVEEIQQRTGLPADRTLIAGFSQGGIMSASLALTSPESVAGFGIISGRILSEITPLIAAPARLAHLQALILHGEHDNTLPLAWAERSAELLQSLGLAFQARHYPARHEISEAMAADFVAWVKSVLR